MTTDAAQDRDEQLERILADYLHAAEAGAPLDEQQLIAAHPDLADDLRSFFTNRAEFQRVAQPLQVADLDPTLAPNSGDVAEVARVRYFGDYELLEELGRGGMGVVYKAKQTTLNRPVALKMILSGQLASADDVLRFKQEAEAAANLDHPHIAPIYETGEHQGQHYFSMKLIEGRSLREGLPELQHDVRASVQLLSQVARAVHHAHQRGVLHRDLKPANILLDCDGVPYVTDFGLAKRVEGGSDVTRTGAIVGTPSYMAPEQASGQKQLSTAVDVYSLGAILYEVLAGQPPFRADSPLETLLQVASQEVKRPRSINPKADRDLETIALKCLDKDPQRRYDSAAALADDLERWLTGVPIQARRSTLAERVTKWSRRHPAVAALVAAIVLLGITSQLLIAWQWRQTVRAFTRGEGLRLVAQSEVVRPVNAGLALALAIEAAERHPGLAANNALLGALAECREQRTLIGHEDQVDCAELSPDGSKVVTRSRDKTARLWDASTGRLIATLKHGSDQLAIAAYFRGQKSIAKEQHDVLAARFSADSSRVITISSRFTAKVWNAATGEQLLLLTGPPYDPQGTYVAIGERGGACADFSRDGKRIAVSFGDYAHPNHSVWIWDAETGKEQAVLKGHLATVQHLQFSPNGEFVATASRDGTACLWNVSTGQQLHKLSGHQVGVAYAIFTPDGQRLVTMGDAYQWQYPTTPGSNISYSGSSQRQDRFGGIIWNVSTGERLASLDWSENSHGDILPAAFSSDGRQLLTIFGGNYGGDSAVIGHPLIWDTLTGKRLFVLKRSTASSKSVAGRFNRDGTRVTLVHRAGSFPTEQELMVTFWDAATGMEAEPAVQLKGHTDTIPSVVLSEDAQRVVTASQDQTARIWDVSAAGDATTGRGHWRGISSARLTADGQRLLTSPDSYRAPAHEFKLWDIATCSLVKAFPCDKSVRQQVVLDISTDGRQALVGEHRGVTNGVHSSCNVSLLDLSTGRRRATLSSGEDELYVVMFSPDGKLVLTGGDDSMPPTLWDAGETSPGKELAHLSDRPHWSARFSPDGTMLLTTSRSPGSVQFDSTRKKIELAQIWDVSTGQLLHTLNDETGMLQSDIKVSWSPDGKHILVPGAGGKIARILDATSSDVVAELKGHTDHITCGSYSPDGRLVATGSHDKTVRLWDASRGRELALLRGHEHPVRTLDFSADGRFLITTGDDQTARLWDVATGDELATFPGDENGVDSAAFTPDSRWVLTVSNYQARLWPVDVVSAAQARQPRELTDAERERFEIPR